MRILTNDYHCVAQFVQRLPRRRGFYPGSDSPKSMKQVEYVLLPYISYECHWVNKIGCSIKPLQKK